MSRKRAKMSRPNTPRQNDTWGVAKCRENAPKCRENAPKWHPYYHMVIISISILC